MKYMIIDHRIVRLKTEVREHECNFLTDFRLVDLYANIWIYIVPVCANYCEQYLGFSD